MLKRDVPQADGGKGKYNTLEKDISRPMKKILNTINRALAIFHHWNILYVHHANKIPVRNVCLCSFPNEETAVPKSRCSLRSHDRPATRRNSPTRLSWPIGSCVFIAMSLFILEILIPTTSFPNLYQKETVSTSPRLCAGKYTQQ